MTALRLVIGNKNYSSWSLRPWLAMKAKGVSFSEELIALDMPDTSARIRAINPAGRVPVLVDGDLVIWESLAILEYLAEKFPETHFWPQDGKARALARCVAHEMHAGFMALRQACPMNLRREPKPLAVPEAVLQDVARIQALWRQCRRQFGAQGPFLFGEFSNADAMFAPVVTRLHTYQLPVDDDTRAYMQMILAHPAFLEWRDAGVQEKWVIAADEVK